MDQGKLIALMTDGFLKCTKAPHTSNVPSTTQSPHYVDPLCCDDDLVGLETVNIDNLPETTTDDPLPALARGISPTAQDTVSTRDEEPTRVNEDTWRADTTKNLPEALNKRRLLAEEHTDMDKAQPSRRVRVNETKTPGRKSTPNKAVTQNKSHVASTVFVKGVEEFGFRNFKPIQSNANMDLGAASVTSEAPVCEQGTNLGTNVELSNEGEDVPLNERPEALEVAQATERYTRLQQMNAPEEEILVAKEVKHHMFSNLRSLPPVEHRFDLHGPRYLRPRKKVNYNPRWPFEEGSDNSSEETTKIQQAESVGSKATSRSNVKSKKDSNRTERALKPVASLRNESQSQTQQENVSSENPHGSPLGQEHVSGIDQSNQGEQINEIVCEPSLDDIFDLDGPDVWVGMHQTTHREISLSTQVSMDSNEEQAAQQVPAQINEPVQDIPGFDYDYESSSSSIPDSQLGVSKYFTNTKDISGAQKSDANESLLSEATTERISTDKPDGKGITVRTDTGYIRAQSIARWDWVYDPKTKRTRILVIVNMGLNKAWAEDIIDDEDKCLTQQAPQGLIATDFDLEFIAQNQQTDKKDIIGHCPYCGKGFKSKKGLVSHCTQVCELPGSPNHVCTKHCMKVQGDSGKCVPIPFIPPVDRRTLRTQQVGGNYKYKPRPLHTYPKETAQEILNRRFAQEAEMFEA